YLEDNLEIALKLGMQLKKPVLPFVWHRFHTSNEDHGLEIMPRDFFIDYIKRLRDYRYMNYGISGVIWWGNDMVMEKGKAGHKIISQYKDIESYKDAATQTILDYLQILVDQRNISN